MDVFTLPELIEIIGGYTCIDSLCDTCSLIFIFKKYTRYMDLNKTYSLMYYNDISFRQKVLNTICEPDVQLTLNLNGCEGIDDVSELGNVCHLYLLGCNITDVSALGNVYGLLLTNCNKITDVSALGNGNVQYLYLGGCHSITDVSAYFEFNWV